MVSRHLTLPQRQLGQDDLIGSWTLPGPCVVLEALLKYNE